MAKKLRQLTESVCRFRHCEAQENELRVGAEAICLNKGQIASLRCTTLAMTIKKAMKKRLTNND